MARPTQLPHIEWHDLRNDGLLHEIAILKKDNTNGDIYYVPIQDLDVLDKKRLLKIVTKPEAGRYPLWDLMSREIMGNGQNALDFFHQLAKIRTTSGHIIPVASNRRGAGNTIPSSDFIDGQQQNKPGRGRPVGSSKK